MANNVNTVGKTFAVVTALCLVCSIFVAGAAVALHPVQARAKATDMQKNILEVAGISVDSGSSVADSFKKNIKTQIIEEARKDCLSLNVTVLGERPCMGEIPADRQAALLNRAKEAIATQWDKEVATYPGSTDCNVPFSLGIPSICFGGYIGKGAHTREEHIYLDSIPAGTAIIAAFLLDYFE